MLLTPVPVTWMTYVPGGAEASVIPPQPFISKAAADNTETSTTVRTPEYRLRNRQKSNPKRAPKGNRPANAMPRDVEARLRAESPPLNGELVSIVNCVLATLLAGRLTVVGKKMQVTHTVVDPQPMVIESVKPPVDVRFTTTAVFWELASVTVVGLKVTVKSLGVLRIEVALEEDGAWSESPR